MKKLLLIFFSSLVIISCSNESEKRKSVEKTNSEKTVAETESESESVLEWTIKQNEKKAEEERLKAENQKIYAEQAQRKKEEYLSFLQVDSLNGKPISFYLENSETHELVKSFYLEEFIPSDNDTTFELLDILTGKNEIIYPFYFHFFNAICLLSDGAISEVMGKHCMRMIYNYPKYTFSFFKDNSQLLGKYIVFITYELYFKYDDTSNIEISESEFFNYLKESLNLSDNDVLKIYNEFIEGIERVKKNMGP